MLRKLALTLALCFSWVGLSDISYAVQIIPKNLVGEWIARTTDENGGESITIKPNGDSIDSRFGRGRISPTEEWAANFVIVYRNNAKCYYYLSFSNNYNDLDVAVRGAGNASQPECIKGYFVRRVEVDSEFGGGLSSCKPSSVSVVVYDLVDENGWFNPLSSWQKFKDSKAKRECQKVNSAFDGEFEVRIEKTAEQRRLECKVQESQYNARPCSGTVCVTSDYNCLQFQSDELKILAKCRKTC